MEIFLFILGAVAPVFILILLGSALKQRKIINDNFIGCASQIGFRLGIPALCFLNIAPLQFDEVFNLNESLILSAFVGISFLILLFLSPLIKKKEQRGSFIQGGFRGNIAILAMALIINIYNETIVARAAMALAFLIPLFNILGVMALTLPFHGLSLKGLGKSLGRIGTNPIIWGVLLGVIFSLFQIPLPKPVHTFLTYLANLALPLSLISIGGTLSLRGFKEKGSLAIKASLIKVILIPLLGGYLFYKLGYRDDSLGMVILMLGAPTAVASHPMAVAMDNDGELAALIVMITTLLSGLTTIVGLMIVQGL